MSADAIPRVTRPPRTSPSAGLTAGRLAAEYMPGLDARRRARRDERLHALTIGGVRRRRPLISRVEGIYFSLRAGVPLRQIAWELRRLADDVEAGAPRRREER